MLQRFENQAKEDFITGIGTALAKHLQALCPNATIARMNQGKFAVLQRAGSIADVNELAHELYKVVASHYKLAARFESLKQAIENDALVLYAQEIRSLQPKDNRISFEVLVRMRDHDGQILAPAEFMPAAEAYGLMPALDRWVIKN